MDYFNINLFSFNVEGLDSILLDPSFITMIQKHDICLLTETMRGDDSKLDIPGFWDYSLIRPKGKKAGRHSGGITVLVKERLRSGIKIAHSSEGFLWSKLDKSFSSLSKNLFICFTYIPPHNTSKELLVKTDYFHDLMTLANKFLGLGDILIRGV